MTELTPEMVEKLERQLEKFESQGIYLISSVESMGDFADDYCGMFKDEPYFLSYVAERLAAGEYQTAEQVRNDVDLILQRFTSFSNAMQTALKERPDEFDPNTRQSVQALNIIAETVVEKVKKAIKKATYTEIEAYYFKLKKYAEQMENSLKSRTEYIALDNIEEKLDAISDHGIPRKVDIND